MPKITFLPNGTEIEVKAKTLILDAVKAAGLSVSAPCGGYGVCGKCLVKVEAGAVEFVNGGTIPKTMVDEGFVLACKAKVTETPITVTIALKKTKEIGKFLRKSEEMSLIEKSLLPTIHDINPIVKMAEICVPEGVFGDGLSDFDRFKSRVKAQFGVKDVFVPIEIMRSFPQILRDDKGKIFASYFIENNQLKIVNIEAIEHGEHVGIAVDIGTTTIAVMLVKMSDASIIDMRTDYNGQIECGLDIISRINYAKKPERLEELRQKVVASVNMIIHDLLSENGVLPNDVVNCSVAANTTMVHLLFGIIPEYIRLSPYVPAVFSVPLYTALDIGFDINKFAPVFVAPSVGSYVGGDITSGLLCNSLCTQTEDVSLFIDIGTNGEIVLGNNDFLLAAACSAGPAFEGGGLKCGMRASFGAIEKVYIDKKTGEATYFTIGDEPAKGICGSGIICVIARLFEAGFLDSAGKFDRNIKSEFFDFSEKNGRYILAKEGETEGGKSVFITESDIDNVMRAKAAIFSACRTLLLSACMDFSDLKNIYIGGGFGRFLDIENCKTIGLLPNMPKETYKFLGNTSVLGAYITLISKKHRETEAAVANKITYVDLGVEAGYMDQYTAALFIPHTDISLFK